MLYRLHVRQSSEAGVAVLGSETNNRGVSITEATFLRVRISCLTAVEAAEVIADRGASVPFAYVVTPNASHFTLLVELKDARFQDVYAHAWLRLLDGKVPRACARIVFGLDLPHCAGSDLTEELFTHRIQPSDSITIIGGGEELRRRLVAQFGLTQLHVHNPPMGFMDKPSEVEACIDFVLRHPARYVFFAVGSPRGEYLARMVQRRPEAVGTGLCIGGSLNFITGLVKRAPAFFRTFGLEWLYRLLRNPIGHARRVFVESLPLLLIVAKARLNPTAYGMDASRRKRVP
ncbi:WecB/TagA/CpsF family glycosyltransferase [Azorhizobium doebereinerae]|uniref:WecB/TagA/CpsF family glycosyltransferase n=1 Tax=Azorhizobium doebereinerae TaxID=281091 RepID=UPI001FD95713|nr:WecB/TagA/CpsF family glycosyltransferase [Azorhizobium doebereinerae]